MALTPREFHIIIQSLWSYFFPKLEYDYDGKLIPVITLFHQYFQSKEGQDVLCMYSENHILFPNMKHSGTNLHCRDEGNQRRRFVSIHVPSVQKTISLPDFIDILLVRPKEVIGCIGIALSVICHENTLSTRPNIGNQSNTNLTTTIATGVSSETEADIQSQMNFTITSTSQSTLPTANIQPIFPQLIGLQPFSPFYELKSESLDRLVSIVGYIVRVSHSRHMITGAVFSCSKCNQEYMIPFEDGIYCPPAVCPTPKCYNKTLDMLRHKVQSTDIQRIKIQEIVLPSNQSNNNQSNSSHNNHQQSSNCHQSNSQSRFHDDDDDDDVDDDDSITHENDHNNNRHRKPTKSNAINAKRYRRNNDNNTQTTATTSTALTTTTTSSATDSRAPRTFEFEVQGLGMVNCCCIAGDVVNAIGIIKTANDRLRVSFGKEAGVHQLYLDANSVSKCNSTGKLERQPHSQSLLLSSSLMPMMDADRSGMNSRNNTAESMATTTINHMSSSSSSSSSLSSSSLTHSFTAQELSQIRRIARSPLCFSLLTSSLCPDIFGLELVKAGLILGLLGGTAMVSSQQQQHQHSSRSTGGFQTTSNNTTKSSMNGNDKSNNSRTNEISVRTDIHVLVVGDPGMGKSQLLRAASALSARSVLVAGHSVSAAGLTASISKESSRTSGGSGGGDVVIEAGALVLADKGVCCIDELDKIDCDYHALLEAMEQQSISIAKSGVITCLKSRAAVLAAANPVNGHYNKSKSVQENLKMPSALLSRFDLVFILVDRPDARNDQMLSEHIMRTHTGATGSSGGSSDFNTYGIGFNDFNGNQDTNNRSSGGGSSQFTPMAMRMDGDNMEASTTLAQRLRRDNATLLAASSSTSSSSSSSSSTRSRMNDSTTNENHDVNMNDDTNDMLHVLNADILRKYIEYAKKYVHPKLTRPAAKILQKQYLSMRAETALGNSVPVTTRHLESLIRLAQARAKAELREEVTAEDASDVVMLLQESLLDAFTGDGGEMGGGRGSDGRRTREGGLVKQVKSIVSAMKRECELRGGNEIFSKQDIGVLCTRLRLTKDVDTIIDVLRTECYLLLKGPQLYRLQAI